MEIFKRHNSEIQHNIDDCKELAEVFFEDELGETYNSRREAYAPLDFPTFYNGQGQPAIPYFLRMTTNIKDKSQSGSVEMLQCFGNGEMSVRSAYATTDKGDFAAQASQDVLFTLPRLSWPAVLLSPQIQSCFEGLRDPHRDPEVDPSELLDELIEIPDSENHVVQKSIDDINIDGFSLSMSYTKHAMPDVLAVTIKKDEPFCEKYRFVIKRNGKINNDVFLHFGRGGRLENYQDARGRNPNKTLADLAALKRMVLN